MKFHIFNSGIHGFRRLPYIYSLEPITYAESNGCKPTHITTARPLNVTYIPLKGSNERALFIRCHISQMV